MTLAFIERVTPRGASTHRARYRCHCGNVVNSIMQRVSRGGKRSCGCDKPPRKGAALHPYQGESLTIEMILRRSGCKLSSHGLRYRMRGGMTLEQALAAPKHEGHIGTESVRPDNTFYRTSVLKRCPDAKVESFRDGKLTRYQAFCRSQILGYGVTATDAWHDAYLRIAKGRVRL